MKLDIFQIDSFASKVFKGNPACVVPLESWLPDEVLLKIAEENAVAETAFFIYADDKIKLRWFTPAIEMDLCGHATLAAAHAIHAIMGYKKSQLIFETASGDLPVSIGNDLYVLDFPSRKPQPATLPQTIKQSLNIQPHTVLKARDYVLIYKNEQEIRDIKIDRNLFDQVNLDPGGVVVTAKGTDCDFVSRYFTPQSAILEDPVTGSAHCSLIPYWSERLNKKQMIAMQISARSGELYCTDNDDRVLIGGKAKTFSVGLFWIDE